MCVGRFLIGLGVGSAAMVIPLYIAEISPAKCKSWKKYRQPDVD